jgi:Ni/Co efflux regulator RcnB
MKRLLTAAIALSLLTGTAAMAQPDHRDDRGGQSQGRDDQHGNDRSQEVRQGGDARQAQQQHWARGQRMPSTYYRDSSRYVDYRANHLRAPRRGYRWVRTDDNNYAMVAIASGLIASIAAANH